jgi:hypothetical protein
MDDNENFLRESLQQMLITEGYADAHDRSLMFLVIFGPDQVLMILSSEQQFDPVLVAAVLLFNLKFSLENFLVENVLDAVFSSPESKRLFAGTQRF